MTAPATPEDVRAYWTRKKAEIMDIECQVYGLAASLGTVDPEIRRRLEEAGRELISASARAGVWAREGRMP